MRRKRSSGAGATGRGNLRAARRAAGLTEWARAGQAASDTAQTSLDTFARQLAAVDHSIPVRDVDLLIRTGGEYRLSDFLLWECAYAELVFTPRMWPEFSARDLEAAITEYQRRERRFGDVGESNTAAAYESA